MGFNCPEWFYVCTGVQMAGGISAGIYTTTEPDLCKYLADDSQASFAFVEDNKQLKKFLAVRSSLPALKHLVVWGEPPLEGSGALSWEQFMEAGKDVPDADVKARTDELLPGHAATLIYTSGTTGPPKAVMLSHDNLAWVARVICFVQFGEDAHNHSLSGVSYLPLSHIAAQILDMHCCSNVGACVSFAQPDALKGSLKDTLLEVQPAIFFGVPRVFTKFEEKVKEIGSKITGFKKTVATLAKSTGAAYSESRRTGQPVPWSAWFARPIASFIIGQVRSKMGFGRTHGFFTGAAPIELSTLNYFAQFEMPILEVYGMSETTALITENTLTAWEPGTTGVVPDGIEVKLLNPSADGEGEIAVRGRCIMMGYMGNEAATRETFTEDGFLRTGDLGRFVASTGRPVPGVEKPFLKITGRIKELLITEGGENIPPVIIESKIKDELPAISNVVVIGDKRKYLTCLVTCKTSPTPEGTPSIDLAGPAKLVNPAVTTSEQAVSDPQWLAYVEHGLQEANKKADSNAQKVQKFRILPHDFSHLGPDAELGPTMKLMRRKVYQKWGHLIDEMYPEVVAAPTAF